MKKFCLTVVTLMCLFTIIPVASAADSVTCELSELNMTIDVPADWITFTRDIDENDPNLELLGTTAETLISTYEANSIYFNAVYLDPLSEIVVTMITDESSQDIYDFNRISDKDMPQAAETIREEMQKIMGDAATYTESSFYTHEQAKFAVFNFETSGALPDHAQQYTTIINGQTINVTLHSYTGELTTAQEQLLEDVVNSITFTKVTKKPGIDLSEAGITAIIGGVVAGIVALVISLINRNKRKIAGATVSSAGMYDGINPGNAPYPDDRQYPGNPPDDGPQA